MIKIYTTSMWLSGMGNLCDCFGMKYETKEKIKQQKDEINNGIKNSE